MNDMYRAVNLQTGKIIQVSSHIAKQPSLMADYGYMLQPLPEEDIAEELKAKFDEGSKLEFTITDKHGITSDLTIEKTEDGIEVYPTVDMFPVNEPLIEAKPKRIYNKQIK